jgi:peptidoglycan/LPS O-acetylase OafA/YrhL
VTGHRQQQKGAGVEDRRNSDCAKPIKGWKNLDQTSAGFRPALPRSRLRRVSYLCNLTVMRDDLRPLTSLRFFAAAIIVLHHLRGGFGIPMMPGYNLASGVSLFFVLSGFILTYSYPSLRSWAERKVFLRKRFARIWPAHMTAIAVWFCVVPGALDEFPPLQMAGHFLTNVAMVQTWVPLNWTHHSFNGPSWSIATEFAFYLMFPLLIFNFERTWWWKLALIGGLIAVVILLCDAFAIPGTLPPTGGLDGIAIFYFHPAVRVLEFAGVMVTALLWRRWNDKIVIPILLATLVEALVIANFVFNPMGGWMYQHVAALRTPAAAQWFFQGGGALLIPCCALIFVLACGRGWISRILSLSGFVLLGQISYSIYLLHMPLLRTYASNAHHFADVPGWAVLVVYLAAVLAAAYLVFTFIETPARSMIVNGHLRKPQVA